MYQAAPESRRAAIILPLALIAIGDADPRRFRLQMGMVPMAVDLRAYVELLAHCLRGCLGRLSVTGRLPFRRLREEMLPIAPASESQVRPHRAHAAAHHFKPVSRFQGDGTIPPVSEDSGTDFSCTGVPSAVGFRPDGAGGDPGTGGRSATS